VAASFLWDKTSSRGMSKGLRGSQHCEAAGPAAANPNRRRSPRETCRSCLQTDIRTLTTRFERGDRKHVQPSADDRGEHGQAAGAFATTLVHALGDPNSPVCRQDQVKLFLGCGDHPAADSTSARKCESVFAVAVDNGNLHIAFERSGIYWLP
jgi:hypothetical protein